MQLWQWEITPSPSIDERVHGREVEESVCVCARLLWQHVNVVRVSINRNSRLWSARDCVTVPRRRVRQSVWCPCWYLCLVAASKRCGEMNVKPGVDYSASFSGLTLRSLRVCPVFLLCSRYREASSAGTSMCAQPLSCSTGQWCDQLAEILAVWTAFTLTPTLGRWTVSAHSGWLVVVFVCCRIL